MVVIARRSRSSRSGSSLGRSLSASRTAKYRDDLRPLPVAEVDGCLGTDNPHEVISETARRVRPWYRDRGVLASTAFTLLVLSFNEVAAQTREDQVNGLLAVSPMLAAVLVERARRVLIAFALAVVAFFAGSLSIDFDFDD